MTSSIRMSGRSVIGELDGVMTGWLVTQRFGGGTCFISPDLLGLHVIRHLRHRQPDSIVAVAVKNALGKSRW